MTLNVGTIKNVFSFSVQIRKKLVSKQMIIEKSEKAKKMREQRKFGKKVGVCFYTDCLFGYRKELKTKKFVDPKTEFSNFLFSHTHS